MKTPLPRATVRLTPETWEQVNRHAALNDMGQAEYIRHVLEGHFEKTEGSGANLRRIAELSEYTQLAVDRIMRRDFPDLIDPLLNAVRERLATHHGK